MPNPVWVTAENVKFNGTLDNAAVLTNSGGIRTLVLWDKLSLTDQEILIAAVDAYGSTLPIVAQKANQTIALEPSIVGGTSTGLSAVATSTAGKATVDLGAAKVGTDPSGLSAVAGTAGYQAINYLPAAVGGNALGLQQATAGRQTASFGGNITGGSQASGLANNTTTYTATIVVDGVSRPISIVGSAAQTITTLISEINTDLGASATAALAGGNIVVTSATTGSTSTVAITAGTLFPTLTGFNSVLAAVNGVNAGAYTMSVSINGTSYPVSIVTASTLTFTNLVSAINAAIGANGTAAIVNGNIRITSATVGVSSKVVITAGNTLSATAGFAGLQSPLNGSGKARTYSATAIIDGTTIKSLNFTGVQGTTITNVLTEINTDLGAAATAALTGGDIVITSASTGKKSSVQIIDGGLFSSLAGYASVGSVSGDAPTTYTATVTLTNGGTVLTKNISFDGNTAQTYATLVTAIQAGLTPDATVSLVAGGLKIVNDQATGPLTSITIDGGTLVRSLSGQRGIAKSLKGVAAADLATVLNEYKAPNGASVLSTLPVIKVGTKPAVPFGVKHTTAFIYWNGTVWKYLDNDANV